MNHPATPFSSSEEWAKFRTEQFEIVRSEEAEEESINEDQGGNSHETFINNPCHVHFPNAPE